MLYIIILSVKGFGVVLGRRFFKAKVYFSHGNWKQTGGGNHFSPLFFTPPSC